MACLWLAEQLRRGGSCCPWRLVRSGGSRGQATAEPQQAPGRPLPSSFQKDLLG